MHPSMNVKTKVKRNVASVADTTGTISILLSFSSVTVESITTELYYYYHNNKIHGLDILLNLLLHSTFLRSGSHLL